MSRCCFCRKKTHLPFKCKWCVKEYCVHCVMVEIHLCQEIQTMKKEMQQTHGEKMHKERTVDVKIIHI